MISDPEITILTVVYNGKRYIREAIDSILDQTYTDFEYIVVDNDSTDGTPDILNQYTRKDRRISIIKEPKRGVLHARNAGLRAAKGKWIAVLDADDAALPTRLERQLDFVRQNLSFVLVGSGCVMVDELGQFMKGYRYPPDHSTLVSRLERQKPFFPHSSAFYSRRVVSEIGGYRFPHAEDYDLWFRLSEHGDIACISEPLIKLRRTVMSRSYNISQEPYILFKLIILACHLRRKHGLSDPFLKQEKWDDFLEWTRIQMENYDCFRKGKAQREFFRIWYSKDNNKLIRIFQLFYQFISNRFLRVSLLDRSYLAKAAIQIAQKSAEVFND
jgi:glycosyltransferase involved in cell wall biosynthesis